MDSMAADLSEICSRLSSYSAGLPINPDPGEKPEKCCLGHIRNCLVILDAYLLQNRTNDDEDASLPKGGLHAQHASLADGLVALVTLAGVSTPKDTSEAMASRRTSSIFLDSV